jgi:prolyl-tRNA synthetase
MRLSKYFLPTLKENPVDATIASHQLMIRAGMIRQTASGIYSWLPLGLKVLRNIEKIIKQEMAEIGVLEVSMSPIQPKELWEESGRYEAYGKEMLRIKDRNDRDILYGPTHEEIITDIVRRTITSYKDLPKHFFQIQSKFRDEIRPRFGVMRGREFLMKDSYSFDLNEESALKTYNLMYETYFKIFRKMGVTAIALQAETGAIGGELSHEFHILAATGESAVFYDKKFDELAKDKNFDVKAMQEVYAMADDLHDEEKCPVAKDQLKSCRGIEVGQLFHLGLKYSKAMNAQVMGPDSKPIYPNMGCFGIGVSRLVGAIIESSHDEKGIIWPKEIAPFQIALINVKSGDELCDKVCEEIYAKFKERNVEVIYDDTKAGLGQKFAIMDLIGIPTQIVVGPKSAAAGKVEVKDRKTGEKEEVLIEGLFK